MAVYCSVLHRIAEIDGNQLTKQVCVWWNLCMCCARRNTLQHTATHCNTLQHTATHCNTLQHVATHCNTIDLVKNLQNQLLHTATHCHTLQHTATHCNTFNLVSILKMQHKQSLTYETSHELSLPRSWDHRSHP